MMVTDPTKCAECGNDLKESEEGLCNECQTKTTEFLEIAEGLRNECQTKIAEFLKIIEPNPEEETEMNKEEGLDKEEYFKEEECSPIKLRNFVIFHEHRESEIKMPPVEGNVQRMPDIQVFCGRCCGTGTCCPGCSGLTDEEGFGSCEGPEVTCPDCTGMGWVTEEQFHAFSSSHLRRHFNKERIMKDSPPISPQKQWSVVVQGTDRKLHYQEFFLSEEGARGFLKGLQWFCNLSDTKFDNFFFLQPGDKVCKDCCEHLKGDEKAWDLCAECTALANEQGPFPEVVREDEHDPDPEVEMNDEQLDTLSEEEQSLVDILKEDHPELAEDIEKDLVPVFKAVEDRFEDPEEDDKPPKKNRMMNPGDI